MDYTLAMIVGFIILTKENYLSMLKKQLMLIIIKLILPVNNSLIAFPAKRDDKTSVITSDIINEKFTARIILASSSSQKASKSLSLMR
jgi:hypothetical protein